MTWDSFDCKWCIIFFLYSYTVHCVGQSLLSLDKTPFIPLLLYTYDNILLWPFPSVFLLFIFLFLFSNKLAEKIGNLSDIYHRLGTIFRYIMLPLLLLLLLFPLHRRWALVLSGIAFSIPLYFGLSLFLSFSALRGNNKQQQIRKRRTRENYSWHTTHDYRRSNENEDEDDDDCEWRDDWIVSRLVLFTSASIPLLKERRRQELYDYRRLETITSRRNTL